jgi:hypothetical protein
MSSVDDEYLAIKRLKSEQKMDHLQGLELLYDKIKVNRSVLQTDKRLLDDPHAMVADKAFLADMLRVKLSIDKLREELAEPDFD